jgi:hypothetical protein
MRVKTSAIDGATAAQMPRFIKPRLATLKSKAPVYMGKVGTGWSRTVSSQIRKQLDTVVSPKSKLTKPIREPKAT